MFIVERKRSTIRRFWGMGRGTNFNRFPEKTEAVPRKLQLEALPHSVQEVFYDADKRQAFTVRVGTKYLINQEKFAAFLNCEALGQDTPEPDRRQPSAGIQPVPVRL